MRDRFQRASLAPDGFVAESVQIVGEIVHILLRSRSPTGLVRTAGGRAGTSKADICVGLPTCQLVAAELN